MKMKYCILFLPVLTIIGCVSLVFVGTRSGGFSLSQCPRCSITPEEAHTLAEPWLELSYSLRNSKRNFPSDKLHMDDYILLKGDYYYITRDNYPYKAYRAYLKHAVRVDCRSGKVIEPR